MPHEPSIKRAVAFVDGQNLFHAAREVFGHTYPDYNILALAPCWLTPNQARDLLARLTRAGKLALRGGRSDP
jgi:hypothetical protein